VATSGLPAVPAAAVQPSEIYAQPCLENTFGDLGALAVNFQIPLRFGFSSLG
jgi:hypothetical protein